MLTGPPPKFHGTRDILAMAATRTIVEESGTCTGFVHPHNGYYAGDFSRRGVPCDPADATRRTTLVASMVSPAQLGRG